MIQVKIIAPNAEKYVHYASRFGAQLQNSKLRSLSRVFDGYIFRAVRKNPSLVVVYVLTLAPMWLFGAEFSSARYASPPQGLRFTGATPVGWRLTDGIAPSYEPSSNVFFADPAEMYATAGSRIFQTDSAVSAYDESYPGTLSPLIAHGNAVTMCKQYGLKSGQGEGPLGPTWFTGCAAYAGSSSFAKFVLPDGEGDKLTNADANYLHLQIFDRDCPTLFGIENLGLNIGHCTLLDEEFSYEQGHRLPTQAYIVPNASTGKRTDMLVVMPVVQHRAPPAHHQFAHDRGDDRLMAVYGHAILRADLSMTEEQKTDLGSELLHPIGDRILHAQAKLLTDYPAHDIQFYQAAVYDDKETPSPADDEYLVFEPAMPEENRIIMQSSAVREPVAGDQPAQPRALRPGELPDYYGPLQLVVANITAHEYRDPPCPGRRLLDPGAGTSHDPGPDSNPDHAAAIRIRTQVFTYDYAEDGSVSESVVELDGIDLYYLDLPGAAGWPAIDRHGDWGWSAEWGEYYPQTAPGSQFVMRYLYCPSGPAIPVSRITISEYIAPAEPGKPGPNNVGQQDSGSARFALIYPGGTETVFDLGRYSPPRPVMRGLWFRDHFKAIQQFAYDTNVYGSEASVQGADNPVQWWGLGPMFSTDYNAGYSWMAGSSDPSKVCRRTVEIGDSPAHQKIHVHLGNGKIGILATGATDAAVRVDWSFVTCFEDSGALEAVRGVVFEGLPLESSNWVSIVLYSQEHGDQNGNITREAVLIASLQRPRALFSPAYAAHQKQGRSSPWMMDDLIQPENNFDTRCLHRISRDGGRTWYDFIEGMPGDGYELGNPLKSKDHAG